MKSRTFVYLSLSVIACACSGIEPRYVTPEKGLPTHSTLFVDDTQIEIEATAASSDVYKVKSSAANTHPAPIFLTAIEDCGPQRTSLSGRLRQLFVGISLESLHVEESITVGTTRASVGYSNGRLEEKNLVLSAVNLLPNDSCSVDVVFWSTNPDQSLVRDRTFIIPVADQFLSLLRRS
jgi:hypothetical protein